MISADMSTLTPAANCWRKWRGRDWIVAMLWTCHVCARQLEFHLQISPGFRTDGGSIPIIFQNLFIPLGKYLLAFLIHDALYATEYCTRLEADRILLEVLEWQGACWIRRNIIYAAVRCFGWRVWRKHTPESLAAARYLITFDAIKGFQPINNQGAL